MAPLRSYGLLGLLFVLHEVARSRSTHFLSVVLREACEGVVRRHFHLK